MPVLLSRTPLEPLSNMNSMSSNTGASSTRVNGAKRKPPTRLNFLDDDDAGFGDGVPAKKKMKSDDAAGQNGRKANGVEKKGKNLYEEQSDGFVFSRRQPKRAAASKAEEMTYEPGMREATKTKKRSSTPQTEEEQPKRRRSARLSGDKEKNQQSSTVVEASKPKTKRALNAPVLQAPNGREYSPEGEVASLHVDKKTRDGTKIALPFADTPVIKRNKEMREKSRRTSGSKNRRSSTGIRGRRASSLIESGTSNAVPHADVEISDFYKLIEDGLPEPKRFKQLLTWCASRALIDKPRPTTTSNNIETIAIESARQIQEELIKDFASKSEFSDWWTERDHPVSSRPKKPNPRNARNEAKIKELEAEIQRLENEETTWKSLLPSKSAKKETTPAPAPSSSIDSKLLSASQQSLLSLLDSQSISTTTESTEASESTLQPFSVSIASRINELTSNLEPTVDLLADGVHHLSQFNGHASRVADRIKGVWARRLERRDEEAKKEAGSDEFGARDVLRALSGKLNE